MTNDFVALLKDSSLVSVLTVVELTKQTQIMATNTTPPTTTASTRNFSTTESARLNEPLNASGKGKGI